jgi:glyoxylase-like metal-dependent hydrolase (beta-lactamase superfamily II)
LSARRLARAFALLLALALLAAAAGLVAAHREMRSLDPPLPALDALRGLAADAELPVRVSYWNTASQPMPRSQVLERSRDPSPGEPYVMSHPAFVLQWADGRILLVDTGMDRDAALAFGRPIEWLGAAPIEPHASLAEALGASLGRARLGLVFTHLHTDHTSGVGPLCAALRTRDPEARIRLFQTEAQATRANWTTRPGRAQLARAACLDAVRLADAAAAPLPGFPGAFVIRAAGHTPGSQVVGAWVRDGSSLRGYLFGGDVANAWDGIRFDVPKPWAYSLFVVPESATRLQRMRRFLREASEAGLVVVVSHDQRALEASGIPVLGR